MSKKRKATAGVASPTAPAAPAIVDITSSTPRAIASILLSVLTHDATVQDEDAKKLFKAFDLFKAELTHRTNAMARTTETTGANEPFLFFDGQIALPEELFIHILEYISHYQFVHNAALVSKAWLSATRTPTLWTKLDHTTGLAERSKKKRSLTDLLTVIKHFQFASLKTLVLPSNIILGKSGGRKIAKACPFLEELDIGSAHAQNEELVAFPSVFPHLCKIRFDMWNVTNLGVTELARNMGERLVDLRIRGTTISQHGLSDSALQTISEVCPNIERFDYLHVLPSMYYESQRDGLSETGVTALVRGCRKLRSLTLVNTKNVGLEAFEAILGETTNLLHLRLKGIPSLFGTETANIVRLGLIDTVDYCKVLGGRNGSLF